MLLKQRSLWYFIMVTWGDYSSLFALFVYGCCYLDCHSVSTSSSVGDDFYLVTHLPPSSQCDSKRNQWLRHKKSAQCHSFLGSRIGMWLKLVWSKPILGHGTKVDISDVHFPTGQASGRMQHQEWMEVIFAATMRAKFVSKSSQSNRREPKGGSWSQRLGPQSSHIQILEFTPWWLYL